jgi:DNA mismatch endonuclease (patch repair protein)
MKGWFSLADIVSSEKRSEMMSGIRSKNTTPEIIVRTALHKQGFRFRLHQSKLPGKPDLVFSKHNAVIFTHGCFWHGHGCHFFKWPSSRPVFWKTKINRNKAKDKESLEQLLGDGWRVMIIWECALRGANRVPLQKIISEAAKFLTGSRTFLEKRGKQ